MDCFAPSLLPQLWAALEREDAKKLRHLEWGRRFLPHWHTHPPADFHRELDALLHDFHHTRGQRVGILAPRGGAKSTHITFQHVLRTSVEGWEPYTLLLSDSGEQAAKFLRDIRDECETNAYLNAVYPEAVAGGEWRESAVRLRNGVRIEAFGRGAKIRGRRNRKDRPTQIVIDDCQGNRDITSQADRGHAWEWLTREVIPAGDERTNILSAGTALHRDAVAVRVGQLPGWRSLAFAAVHAWPDRVDDLWQEWERIATNLADPDRTVTAATFYAANKGELERGARVYWPEKFPLPVMMMRLAEIGRSAFMTEYQQIPTSIEGVEWPPEYFDDAPGNPFFFDEWSQAGPIAMRVVVLDPSRGINSKPGDYQAHIDIRLTAKTDDHTGGDLFVEAHMHREPVPEMIARTLRIAREGPIVNRVVFEDNGTMGFLAPEVRRQVGEGLVPWDTVSQVERKETRIRCLHPYLSRGAAGGTRRQIRVRNTVGGRLLVDQMKDFPLGDHDDGPDALSLGIRQLEMLINGR